MNVVKVERTMRWTLTALVVCVGFLWSFFPSGPQHFILPALFWVSLFYMAFHSATAKTRQDRLLFAGAAGLILAFGAAGLLLTHGVFDRVPVHP
jgi:hypothetical protein